jgi:hypothetical protein
LPVRESDDEDQDDGDETKYGFSWEMITELEEGVGLPADTGLFDSAETYISSISTGRTRLRGGASNASSEHLMRR